MKRRAVALVVVLVAAAVCWNQPIRSQDPDVAAERAAAKFAGDIDRFPDSAMSVIVHLINPVDVLTLDREFEARRVHRLDRHEAVVTSLQERAAVMQTDLLADLAVRQLEGGVTRVEPFWIQNAVRVDGTKAEIRRLLRRDDVRRVYPNYGIEGIAPVDAGTGGDSGGGGPLAGGVESGVAAVRAPEVWAMGITGAGVLVANIDTGVDGNHPALASRWAGVADPRYAGHPEWAWLDPFAGNNTFPYDDGGHGTHTMGSVCGGSPGDGIGVAPGALWMAAGAIDRGGGISQTVADAIESFQWMIDPDGDPSTSFDVPDVCSNSWGLVTSHGYPECDETFWSFIDACEAAGTCMLFSAGNEGSSGLRRPADRATTPTSSLAVAAVDANDPAWPIASFSSRGPTFCTPLGGTAIKPDISAPGVSVRSAWPGGGYQSLSGTSMASPHINGVVALMLEANPGLSVQQTKQILYDTAVDLGPGGEDNAYGWGMVDAVEAVNAALALSTLRFDFPDGRPEFVDPAGGTSVRVEVTGSSVSPEPGTGMLHYDDGGGTFTAIPMQIVAPNVYDAVFPGFDCGAGVSWYVSAETTDGEVVTNPFNAPDSTHAASAYSGVTVAFSDDFQTDTGWTVEDSPGLADGSWQRAVPAGGGDRGDPATDDDGSGACFVTDNADDNSDVDDGTTWLISPILDFTAGVDPIVEYSLWYTNNFGADPNNDVFRTWVSNDGGASWVLAQEFGPLSSPGWTRQSFLVSDFVAPTNQGRVRFEASDLINPSVVEAGIDAFEVKFFECDPGTPVFDVVVTPSVTTVPRGSTLPFVLEITNTDSSMHTVDLWAVRTLPGGTVQDPWRGPKVRTFAPGETKTFSMLSLNIGVGLDLGDYRLDIRVGDAYPTVWGEAGFDYTVVE